MDIIHRQVEKLVLEGKTYKEISEITNLDIGSLYRIKNGYLKHLDYIKRSTQSRGEWAKSMSRRHGLSFLEDIKSLHKNPYITLSFIADKYGLSPEYIRQCYIRFYNKPYAIAVEKKRKLKNSDMSCGRDPRNKVVNYKKGTYVYDGAVVEKFFLEKCINLGFDVKAPCTISTDLIVNGKCVEVKSSKKPFLPSKSNKTSYYRYKLTNGELNQCDFVAAYHKSLSLFYIIPNIWRGKKGHFIYIRIDGMPVSKSKYNGYVEYKNRFDLLSDIKTGSDEK